MSVIPPNWLGSAAQTQGAQSRAAVEKQKEAASQADSAGGDTFADRLQNVIDNTDRDGQVYSDAEGAGSQGRPFGGSPPERPPDEDADPTPDEGGLDVEA